MNDAHVRRAPPPYDAAAIEAKWQARWQEVGCFKSTSGRGRKFFNLDGGPFPNGPLHMGHARTFTLGDVMARYQRMRGRRVLYCFEFDAFGLPNELAAEALGITPEALTRRNIAQMREQMSRLGLSYDWDHVTTTCDPKYYRWTQWLFLKLRKHGLVHRGEADLNWCPSCRTTLAHMQAEDGRCWRCETPVESRRLTQWFIALSRYSAVLSESLDRAEGLSARVRNVLHGFIGRTDGIEVDFPVSGRPGAILTGFLRTELATASPGFLAVAPGHPAMRQLLGEHAEQLTRRLGTVGREVRRNEAAHAALDAVHTGLTVRNGQDVLPVLMARHVEASFATGIAIGCPAADPRDAAFAAAHGIRMPSAATLVHGRPSTHYRVRDWLVSRQRSWGTPIPIIHCPACGEVPVPDRDLPVLLPALSPDMPPGGLAAVDGFADTTCPHCHRAARRETDTLDCYFDVAWCFLACASGLDTTFSFRAEDFAEWMPVDFFHNGLDSFFYVHLYRFIGRVLHELGILPDPEPIKRYVGHDAVLLGGRKMSKHHGNVVAPDEVVAQIGADALRVHLLWAANPLKSVEWNDKGLERAQALLTDIRELALAAAAHVRGCPLSAPIEQQRRPPSLARSAAHTSRRVTEFMERYQYGGCLQELQTLAHRLAASLDRLRSRPDDIELRQSFADALGCLIRLLAPFAPHLAEELWEQLGGIGMVVQATWPADAARAEAGDQLHQAV